MVGMRKCVDNQRFDREAQRYDAREFNLRARGRFSNC